MYIMQTPAKYLQGENLIDDIGSFVKEYGKNFLILTGKTAYKLKEKDIEKSFKKHDLKCTFVEFNGESTMAEINRIIDVLKKSSYDGVIGMGGGKALDTAKSAAFKMKLATIIVPTVAASDAPCSCESMIYTEDGVVEDCEVFPRNPDLVLVDSDMISKAPVRTLVAGMGDALATFLEARTCYENDYDNVHDMKVTESAYGLSRLCYDILLKYGYLAKCSAEEKVVSSALEKVIEANIYLSGVGFENGGLSCSHSVGDALSVFPECHDYMHGEKVAFGCLCQLIIEDRPASEINEFLQFCVDIDLPITFKQIGIVEGIEEKIHKLAGLAHIEDPSHECKMPPGISRSKIYASIILADRVGTEFLEGKQYR